LTKDEAFKSVNSLSWLALAFHVRGLGHEIKETDFVSGKLTAITAREVNAGTGAGIAKKEKDPAMGADGVSDSAPAPGSESATKPSRRRVRRSVRRGQGIKREHSATDQDLD